MIRAVLTLIALLVLAAPVAAQTVQPVPIIIGTSYALPSAIYGGTREINVWTPPGYATSGKTYPVLYLLDGGLEYQDFHHISGLAQLGSMSGMTREMIVVGVTSKDRQNELAGPTREAAMIARYPNHGQSDRFRRFLVDEVEPFVQGRYRTDGETAVIGESLAALFIVETFLREPTAFGRYLAISPSLWWDGESLSKDAPALLAAQPAGERTLLLTIADEGGEMQSGMDRLVEALKAGAPQGLTWRYEARPGETHGTIYHGAAFDFLREVYGPLPTTEH